MVHFAKLLQIITSHPIISYNLGVFLMSLYELLDNIVVDDTYRALQTVLQVLNIPATLYDRKA
jgi:hypothetical protein